MDHANYTVFTLATLLVIQQVYYLSQVNKLVDKLMSRNYHEYEQAKSQSLPLTASPVVIPEDPEDLQGTFGGIGPL